MVVHKELVRTLWKVTDKIKGSLESELMIEEMSSVESKIFCLEALKERSFKVESGKRKALMSKERCFWIFLLKTEGAEGSRKEFLVETIHLETSREWLNTIPWEAKNKFIAKGEASQKLGEKTSWEREDKKREG